MSHRQRRINSRSANRRRGQVIENDRLDFVTGRCGRGPLFSRRWITFYSALVSISRQRSVAGVESIAGRMACAGEAAEEVQNPSDEHPEHKAGSDGALRLRPAFLYRAEFGLFCHASKLAEERRRSSASPCGLFWRLEARGLRLETEKRPCVLPRFATHPRKPHGAP